MNRDCILGLAALTVLFVCGGATCSHRGARVNPLAPVAFTTPPTLGDVMQVVNANSQSVRQLHSDSAAVSTSGVSLRATLSLERPRRFRLRAKLFSPELDLGSNDDVFWFWAKSSPDPGVYFARHEALPANSAGHNLPVQPTWIIDALGLVTLDPAEFHEGPFPRGNGLLEVRSRLRRGADELTRSVVVDASYGWVVEQALYDPHGRMLASARASEHRHYPQHGVSLPHHVEVQLPPAGLSFQIEIGDYIINQPFADPWQLWSLPNIEGHPPVDLAAAPAMAPPTAPVRPPLGGANYGPPPRAGFRPPYRGYTRRR